ncbi:MAG: Gfo/Idh/MocA family oxidoreductase [Oscillospiraceae bacterium]|nr:Gfo/Idh/MocA family oxidoreductase [Oscillospiraceae bacterium]
MLKVGMIGFGAIAKLHKAAYDALSNNGKNIRLVAVCDTSLEQFTHSTALNISSTTVSTHNFNKYSVLDEMLEKEDPDIIDICVPTPVHCRLACEMLGKSKNVLCEKPMARTYEECQLMLDAKNKSGKQLMIGQCVRFMPHYRYLKTAVCEKTFGEIKSAFFYRLSSPPVWGFKNWLLQPEKSGGCLLDMHIHDLDFSRFLFGEPDQISCSSSGFYADYDLVHSRLVYSRGSSDLSLTVEATGDWSLSPSFPFSSGYRVNAEKATIVCEGTKVTVYPIQGEAFSPELDNSEVFYSEIDYFRSIITSGAENTINPPESAALSVRLAESLRASADAGGTLLKY